MTDVRSFQNVFITVGTTKFDALIAEINTSKVATVLRRLGLRRLTVQIGSGHDSGLASSTHYQDINVEVYTLRPSIKQDICAADLVISHAGAGTCIDVLTENVPLVVVVNDQLMDNHQTELADQLSSDGYLLACRPYGLADRLNDIRTTEFRPYSQGSAKPLVMLINRMMMFE